MNRENNVGEVKNQTTQNDSIIINSEDEYHREIECRWCRQNEVACFQRIQYNKDT